MRSAVTDNTPVKEKAVSAEQTASKLTENWGAGEEVYVGWLTDSEDDVGDCLEDMITYLREL